jgi:UDP-GlcNAc:undecaprenyl-phosphate GlcNAc-1-phosphate transferase
MLSIHFVLPLVFASTLFALFVINAERDALSKRARRHVYARQSSHTKPTPRIGGVAIAVGILSGVLLSGNDLFGLLLWTTLPIFLIGLMEDIGPDSSRSVRLIVSALSAVLAVIIFGEHIHRVDIAFLDVVLGVKAIAILFTIFASVGMTHAVNLIDGLNGLSSFVVVSVMVAFGAVALQNGQFELLTLNLIVCTSFLAFACLNFPNGKIFLGDAGAYSIGHIIAWNAILLMVALPNASAWGILLIVLWPVLDTIFAIVRRFLRGQAIGEPDKLHFHQLLMRALIIRFPRTYTLDKANPIASVLTWPFAAAPCLVGYVLIDQPQRAIIATLVISSLYVVTYFILIKLTRRTLLNATTS